MDNPVTARLAADIVVFCRNQVLMITRAWDPFIGCRALPGGHLDASDTIDGDGGDQGEGPEDAAVRELAEEVNVHVDRADLVEVKVYAKPGRDPRYRMVSFAYAIDLKDKPTGMRADDDAASAEWIDIDTVLTEKKRLAFDHHAIITDAVAARRAGRLGQPH